MDSAPPLTNYADAPARHTRRAISSQQRQQLYSLLPQAPPAPPQGPLYFSSEDDSPASPSTSGSWQQQLLPPNTPRDEHHARNAIRDQYQQYQTDQQEQQQQVKRELSQHQSSMVYNIDEKPPAAPPSQPRTAEDPMPSTSDFVKKLYKMLEDPSFQSVVCWGPLGDCFVVKDMNEFTKSILPRMFKHSNFASFVRQLNKYDFHKVKNTDDNQFGEHSWTFRHPDFHADRRDALENIKRKVPAQRKYTPSGSGSGPAASGSAPSSSSAPYPPSQPGGAPYPYPSPSAYPSSSGQGPSGALHTVGGAGARRSPSPTHAHLTSEIQRLKDEGDDLRGRIRNLERNYENVLVELGGFQRGMAQQDGLMQSLIGWFLEGGKGPKPGSSNSSGAGMDMASGSQSQSQSPSQAGPSTITTTFNNNTNTPTTNNSAGLTAQQRFRAHLLAAQAHGGGASPALFAPSITDPGLFLPPQAVRGQGDIGRATLMQMSELSRRAALGGAAPPGEQRAWGGFGADGGGGGGSGGSAGGQGEMGPPGGGQEGRSRLEQLAQLREYYSVRQGDAQPQPPAPGGPWAGGVPEAPAPARGRSLGRTGFSESREREMGVDMEAEAEREREREAQGRGRRLRRRSDSAAGYGARAMAEQQQQQQQQQQMQQQQQQHTPASMSASMSASEQGTPVSVSTPWSMLLPPASGGGTPYASPLQGALAPPVSEGEMMTHEGLQVYTVGHLLPRNTYVEDAQGNWSFDPAALGAGDVLGGLGGVEQQQQQGQGEMGGGGGGGVYGEDAEDGEEVVRPTPPGGMAPLPAPLASSSSSPSSGSGSGSGGQSGATQQKLRVRRSTFVPGWAVPPRVLLVDDDAVSRRLSSKFLKVFGCTTDVAVDGIGAVNKMNLEKYDLVLMDIVMPKLDGVSATNLIRKFDQGTPIISMTSNSKPNEIMTYYSSGMNDILPKPFTKEGLLDMLEKHLMHLKVIQQMSRISRTVGIPPLSDGNFEQALRHGASLMPPPPSSSTSTALIPSSANTPPNAPSPFSFQFFGDGSTAGDADDLALGLARVNPLAGMGLSDEQYGAILQNIVNGDGFAGMMEGLDGVGLGAGLGGGGGGGGEKRALEDGGDERGAKRSRFEVIE